MTFSNNLVVCIGGIIMYSSFGENLQIARERAGYTQTEVAKRTNISQPQLSRYESGVSSPSIDTIRALALLYKVSADYLLGLRKTVRGDRYTGVARIDALSQHYLDLFMPLSVEQKNLTIGFMKGINEKGIKDEQPK